ncbi:hypothetical protein BJY01DRAFT_247690 [Aspergillus pseudoustus]|uniref:ubiquitinyl hydrolase 1 n=1 Tax=Aspergillus pseudoustus TaxID=1810923 RepID=A0ABR4K044_9EURO
MSIKSLQYLYHHIIFPPKLPLQSEKEQKSLDRELLLFVEAALGSFVLQRPQDIQSKWKPVLKMVETWITVDAPGHTQNRHQEALASAISNLKTVGALALHVSAQNCGWIAFYDGENDEVIFDAFEASATVSSILESPGPLLRCFPGQSISIPATILGKPGFCEYLAQSLCRLDLEVVREMCPKASEFRDSIEEDWDTVHPGLVTEKLMVELLAHGKHNSWKSFEKNSRDEVNFDYNGLSWRRSPLLFVLKVALQTVLYRAFPDNEGRSEYKNFMLYLADKVGSYAVTEFQSNTASFEAFEPADVFAMIRAKVARRVYKLQDQTFPFVLERVTEIDDEIAACLDEISERIQNADSREFSGRFDLFRGSDLETSLKHSREYLRNAKLHTPPAEPTKAHKPKHRKRRQTQLDSLFRLDNDDIVSLVDLESWVANKLQDWLREAQKIEKTCCGLADLIETYLRYASKRYADIPDSMSVMLLVVLELWVALDTICTSICPLLADFSPSLQKKLLEPLLLPHRGQMERAQAVEECLVERNKDPKTGTKLKVSVFDDPGPDTFAARYYDTHIACRNRRNKIIEYAQAERDNRRKVWEDLSKKHVDLFIQASELLHETEVDDFGTRNHLPYCKKCRCEQDAKNLSIEVHEWPLPAEDDLAKNVVFELHRPQWFARWRDITWMIIDDFGRSQTDETSHMEMDLLNYPPLKAFGPSQPQRLTLASTIKSWLNTHYRTQNFPVSFEGIALPCALRLHLWDNKNNAWVKDRQNGNKAPKPAFKHHCTFAVNDPAYSALQYAVDTCRHHQNQIIAEHRNHQPQLSAHEAVAFGQLRSGEGLQWYNMLRELASFSLSLAKKPVHDLFCQAAWQLGISSPNTCLRKAHIFFEDLESVEMLWTVLEQRLSSIQSNWNEHYTLQTLVILGTRSLSLGPTSVVGRGKIFLRDCRKVAIEWSARLTTKLESTPEVDTQGHLSLMLQVGGICLLTYSVDEEHLPALLHTNEDLQYLIRSSLLIFENTPQDTGTLGVETRALALRASRVLCHTERQATELIQSNDSGLTCAIKESVQSLQVSSRWQFLEGDNKQWVTNTSRDTQEGAQDIRYNILTGELLIDNERPTRLPERVTKAASFQRLFGPKPISVNRKGKGGSNFTSTRLFGIYRVHFRLHRGSVIVKAIEEGETTKARQTLRYLPQESLRADFPDSLITNHAHWLDLESGLLEFRPLEQAWQHSERNWSMIYRGNSGAPSMTTQGQRILVDIHSEFFGHVSNILGKLDDTKHLVVTKGQDGVIEARLVRLRLTFFVNKKGALECREHSYTVDSVQDVGCLRGLSNKLVLQNETSHRRMVLIPYGTVRLEKGSPHTQVSIEPMNASRLKYFSYSVNTDLGMLSGTSGMLGSLYLAYLHATTSFVLPDPTTKRTGTEEALRILRKADLRSSFPLDSDCTRLLEHIAALTPYRQYYPPQTMPEPIVTSLQKVRWIPSLGPVSQHDDFRLLAQEIFDHARRFAPFHGKTVNAPPGLLRGDSGLLERARKRNAHFYRSQLGGGPIIQHPPAAHYPARDRSPTESGRSARVYEVATLIRRWPTTLARREDLISTIRAWGEVKLEVHQADQYTYTSLLEEPIQELWASLYNLSQSYAGESDKFDMISVLCTTAFRGLDIGNIQLLVAIASLGGFPKIPDALLGHVVDLKLKPGTAIGKPQVYEFKEVIKKYYPPPERNDFQGLGLARNEKEKIARERRKVYNEKRDEDSLALERAIKQQWPCEVFNRPHERQSWQSDRFFDECNDLLQRWTRNTQFYLFVQSIQDRLHEARIVSRLIPQPPTLPRCTLIYPSTIIPHHPPSLRDLLRSAEAPSPMDTDNMSLRALRSRSPANPHTGLCDDLQTLISGLRDSPQSLRTKYVENLSNSLASFRRAYMPCAPTKFSIDRVTLLDYYEDLSEQRDELWDDIADSLKPSEGGWRETPSLTLWPSVTVLSVLSFLAADKWVQVPEPWKDALLIFAKTIAALRRCGRLLEHFDKQDYNSFYKEAEEAGWEGWDPSQAPEWLLLEIEGNMTIRAHQANVARSITEGQENAILQLNMGEGKTAVITPMVAVHLSNGIQIARLVVLKPLLRQSIALLSRQLGGLLNRPVYHIPFSRNTPVTDTTTQTLEDIYDECSHKRGILIVLPEQLLSFRLVGLDLAINGSSPARGLINLELKVQRLCRTVIDESDEVLSPKFQLIFTRGHQQNMDGGSDRWEVIQHVLEEVRRQAVILHVQGQSGLDIDQHGTRYPILYFLKANAADMLLDKVLDAIENDAIPGLSLQKFALPARERVMRFIRCKEIAEEDRVAICERLDSSLVLKRLLVLRGLFAHNVLHFALAGKRWLVDYGIHLTRCLLAVPFRAKGVPSDNAVFGHPEVALTLTCLSYYYEGLTESQVRECVSILATEDDPGAEYQRWIAQCREVLPPGLHSFTGVNLQDFHGFETELFPQLKYQKSIIDFFLSRVVFPREAKEYPFKLSTSAWDIISRSNFPLTTGFSGTNDNQYLLPNSITQNDLPDLPHTNAMVLAQLLRKENQQCVLAEDEIGQQLSVASFLGLANAQFPPIQVIIDVGAQILESSNQEVAKKWLEISPADKAAVVFYDRNDEAKVIDREGHMERLFASPFSRQINRCLVFFDQHHSRGVDIKLPRGYRAAVTLGPRLTKDRLVQACNRMRELGNGQSVVFFIPPEVKHGLKNEKTAYTSFDVLQWALEQTCDQLERLQPLWATQGLSHFRTMQTWATLNPEDENLPNAARRFQEPESRTLLELYAPRGRYIPSLDGLHEAARINPVIAELYSILAQPDTETIQLHEEQEREIMHEVQQEQQQICSPPSVKHQKHEMHEQMWRYLKKGYFPAGASAAYQGSFDCFRTTSAGQFNIPRAITEGLFVTHDFVETISGAPNVEDEFLKPVNWVLSSVENSDILIISQYEANELLPSIRKSEKATLHIYAPRTTKDMRSFSKLDFLSIGAKRDGVEFSPNVLRALELFAGSLYFDKYTEYERAQQFFGFRTASIPNSAEDTVTTEAFVPENVRSEIGWPVASPFTQCPLVFLKTWFSIRMKGNGFSKSHMGTIIEAKPLTREQFDSEGS